MGQVENRRRLIFEVLLFVAAALVLQLLLGLPTRLAIVIPAFALGALEGIAQRSVR
jgi:hypothetical protein